MGDEHRNRVKPSSDRILTTLEQRVDGRPMPESEADTAQMNNPQLNTCCAVATFVKILRPEEFDVLITWSIPVGEKYGSCLGQVYPQGSPAIRQLGTLPEIGQLPEQDWNKQHHRRGYDIPLIASCQGVNAH